MLVKMQIQGLTVYLPNYTSIGWVLGICTFPQSSQVSTYKFENSHSKNESPMYPITFNIQAQTVTQFCHVLSLMLKAQRKPRQALLVHW